MGKETKENSGCNSPQKACTCPVRNLLALWRRDGTQQGQIGHGNGEIQATGDVRMGEG